MTWITLMMGCTGHRYPQALLLADSLADEQPDSSLKILTAIESDISMASEADKMYYRLLCIKAADKNDALEPDTTTMLQLLNYFESHEESLLPTAYYYAGRSYYEVKDMSQALEYFQNAIDAIGENNRKNIQLKTVCYSQMSYVFYFQNLYDESKKCCIEALACAESINDTLSLAYGYRDLAFICAEKDSFNTAIKFLEKAYQYSELVKDKSLCLVIESYLAHCYRKIGDYDKALQHLYPALENINLLDSSAVFSNAAHIYEGKGDLDSANYYFHKVEEVGGVYAKEKAYKSLLLASINHKYFDKASGYYKCYMEYADSVKHITQTGEVARANSLYNFQKKEKENYQLKEANHRRLIIILLLLAILMAIVSALFLLWQNTRRRQAIMAERYKNLQLLKEKDYRRSSAFIIENQQKIQKLEEQLKTVNNDNKNLQKELEREKERLISSNQIAQLGKEEKDRAQRAVRDSDIYRKLTTKGDNILPSNEDWKDLEFLLNYEYDNFCERLKSLCKLSEIKYRISLLIKLELEPALMAELLTTSRANVSTIRSRLYSEVFGKKGSAKDWDDFIKSL